MDRNRNLEMNVLNQISHFIVHQKNVSALMKEILDILYREMGLKRGTFTLRRGDILFIEASHGLSDVEIKRGKYHIGEGITGMTLPSFELMTEYARKTFPLATVSDIGAVIYVVEDGLSSCKPEIINLSTEIPEVRI